MPLKPDQTNTKEYKLVEEGTHLGRCYSILHIGHVPNTFPGAQSPTVNKVRITWELPELLNVFKEGDEPKPYSMSQEFTLSMHEKSNLRKVVQSWLGKKMSDEEANEFDIETLIGKTCMLGVAHMTKNEKTFAVVNSVIKVPASMKVPEQINKSKIITWETMDEPTWALLPPFLQDKMKQSTEYKKWSNSSGYDYPENTDGDVPF